MPSEFQPVARVGEVPNPGSIFVEVDEQPVVLVHAAGSYYALDDLCTHDGGPLSGGTVSAGGSISCPRHGAKFDLETGVALTMPATKATRVHDVKVEGDQIFVRLREK